MTVAEELKAYEQEMYELIIKQGALPEVVPMLMVEDSLNWELIDSVNADIEETNAEELITTLVSFAYPDRTKRFYDGLMSGEIKATFYNYVFCEILEALHIAPNEWETHIKDDYLEDGVTSFVEYRAMVLERQNNIKNKVKTSADMTKLQMTAIGIIGE